MAHIIFNFKYICDVTWLDRNDIKYIQQNNPNYVTVILKTGEQFRIYREQIKPILEEKRKANIAYLKVNESQNKYSVFNTFKNRGYEITPHQNHLTCTCDDWANQSIAFESNQVCCKHIFAVLNHLKLSSLQEYQEYVEDKMIEQLYEKYLTEKDYYEQDKNYF